MKRLLLPCIFGALLCVFLCACAPSDPGVTEPTLPENPAELYAASIAPIQNANDLILKYTVTCARTVGGQEFSESVSGTASYSDFLKSSMTAVIEETLKYGSYESTYQELYCSESAYASTAGNHFSCQLTAQEFYARQLPALLLTSNLYRSISYSENTDTTQILFSDPTGLESWLNVSGDARLISVSGTASVDKDGVLSASTYEAKYIVGKTQYLYQVNLQIAIPKSLDLSAHHNEHLDNAAPLSDLKILKLMMRTVGDVYSANTLTCKAVESIYSEAIPLSWTHNAKYLLWQESGRLTAQLEYNTTSSDYRGNFSTTAQLDRYENGVFSSSIDGKDPVIQENVTDQEVEQSCEDAALSALFATKYLSGATLQCDGDSYRITMTGNEAYVNDLMQGIAEFLKINLDIHTQEGGNTTDASGYLILDAETGLPTAMGLSLERSHVINTVTYALKYRLDHTLSLTDT